MDLDTLKQEEIGAKPAVRRDGQRRGAKCVLHLGAVQIVCRLSLLKAEMTAVTSSPPFFFFCDIFWDKGVMRALRVSGKWFYILSPLFRLSRRCGIAMAYPRSYFYMWTWYSLGLCLARLPLKRHIMSS